VRAWADILGQAFGSIRAHAMRSMLTTLGIVIGVCAVIAVVSVMTGLSQSISQKFSGLGGNSLTVQSHTPFELSMQGRRNRLGEADYDFLVGHLDGVTDVSPMFMAMGDFGGEVGARGRSAFTQVLATTSGYQDARQAYPRSGRFISDSDNTSRRRICVIGEKLRENLGLAWDPVGEFINIGGEPFRIVGVMEKRGELFGFSQDDYALIPFNTGLALSHGSLPDISITLKVPAIDDLDQVKERITALLRKRNNLAPGEANHFKVQTPDQVNASFRQIVDMTGVVLAAMVSLSLLVGGIGIMNIMLVSVTERTREIGIAKALGATPGRIMAQFLLEAALLSLMGGLAGACLGFAIGHFAAQLIPGIGAASVPWWSVVLSVVFSSAVGLVFGFLPAAKAARMEPIAALRYE
jgi:putative ABC transport system permease protein